MKQNILNERITGYNSFLLRRKSTQNFYTLLKRFLMLSSEETIHKPYDTLVSLIEKLKEQDMMQSLTLTLFQKEVLKQFSLKKIFVARRWAHLFA